MSDGLVEGVVEAGADALEHRLNVHLVLQVNLVRFYGQLHTI